MEILVAPRTKPPRSTIERGDVLVVREDGWDWSVAELPNVIKLPGTPVDQKYVQLDREVYLLPKRDSEGNYYNLAGSRLSLDPRQLDLKEGTTDLGKLDASGEFLIESRLSETTREVKMELSGVEIESHKAERIIKHRRYRWDGAKIVSKI